MSDSVAHALAGAGGGMISMSLTYPLITVSTRAQVDKSADAEKKAFITKQIEAFSKVIKNEGPGGLYSGIGSAMFGIALTQGVYYWYEFVKAAFETPERAISTLESMAAGAVAGAATSIITNPIWVVNSKRALWDDGKPTKPLTTFQTIRKILAEEGPQGFFRGIIPALILVINPIIQYTVFERLRIVMQERKALRGKGALSTIDFFLLGAISKLAATSITYPYIVVKSRMQLKQSTSEAARYKSVWDGLTKIAKTEGVKGLYKGIEAKLLQSVLSSAFTFAFKEELFTSAVWLLVFLKLREAKATAKFASLLAIGIRP
ncbi:mitochondrial carrier domain-containing protein [Chytridium lagenaria]|nr:mitochondrial carrier domain-containing protein [Chytridium lagenaria]